MKQKRKTLFAFIVIASLMMAFCDKQETPDSAPAENQTPAEDDYVFYNMVQLTGSVTAVKILAKNGKSSGEITNVRYDGRQEVPQKVGNFVITFDVQAADGWNEVRGLYAGKLAITADQSPIEDFEVVDGALVYYTGSDKHVVIPPDLGIIEIQDMAFYGNKSIVSVIVPTGVERIGIEAFCYCYDLQSISLPKTLTSIGKQAFKYTDLVFIDIPNGVTSIDEATFHESNLVSVTIPSSVTSIGSEAFAKCYRLASVIMRSGVTSIGDYAFSQCDNLASVAIPSSVTSIGESAFFHCDSLASVTIPSNVVSIGDYAFYECYRLASVTIASGVASIGNGAFSDCENLASVEMAYGVTQIGEYAFADCPNLIPFAIPASLTSIGDGIFFRCYNFEEIVLEGNSNDFVVESGVLFNKDMTRIIQFPNGKAGAYTVPASVTDIGKFAFSYSTELTSIIMPSSVTSIDKFAFTSCIRLISVIMTDNVTEIGSYAFASCSKLKQITIIQTKADSDVSFLKERLSNFELVFKRG